jgi:hypothetical protein
MTIATTVLAPPLLWILLCSQTKNAPKMTHSPCNCDPVEEGTLLYRLLSAAVRDYRHLKILREAGDVLGEILAAQPFHETRP